MKAPFLPFLAPEKIFFCKFENFFEKNRILIFLFRFVSFYYKEPGFDSKNDVLKNFFLPLLFLR